MALAAVRPLRERRVLETEEELADFELDVLASFVLARHAAGLMDSTIRGDTNHLQLVRNWFERPLWEMEPRDADRYFGTVLRKVSSSTRAARAQTLVTYFECASQLYQVGADIVAIQELLGHSWISTTMRYVHAHGTRVEDAVMHGQQRAAQRWEGLIR